MLAQSDGSQNNGSGFVSKASAVVCSRIVLNTARRFAYPFAPALSRGLDVPLSAVTAAIGVNQATGILGMIFGPISDRLGYRLMMLVGMSMLVIGMFAAGFLPMYATVLVALFLAGLAKNIFDAALQAYVGEQVPFAKRGMVIGLLELAWAGSTLIGIPVMGVVIDRLGWHAPFLVLGGTGVVGLIAIAIVLPKDRQRTSRENLPGFWDLWRTLARSKPALGALGFAFFFSLANDALFVVYGAWLETAFGLSILAIGASTAVIGAAELTGEIITVSLADRFGLKRLILLGACLTALGNALLPLFGASLTMALCGLFMVYICFEFTFVTYLSLSTELLPGARATMMSGLFAAAGLGRFIGAWGGGYLWTIGGINATAATAAIASFAAVIAMAWGLRGWQPGKN
ncbi:MFS transporter [Desulfosarcina sp.]|uniref:MFS transporter n=1 Tax=Desulfosarcina sp. TaxID=2027861 RepID=UPI0029A41798|nr:MFS transporter [Desulfosarcina sp.]MDX2453065.1 MFS transporter [Desulfosarcina sp.]